MSIWATAISVWFATTLLWWVFYAVINTLMEAVTIPASDPMGLFVFNSIGFTWHVLPVLLFVVYFVWALWTSMKQDVETSSYRRQ